jgi:hypothetical protein
LKALEALEPLDYTFVDCQELANNKFSQRAEKVGNGGKVDENGGNAAENGGNTAENGGERSENGGKVANVDGAGNEGGAGVVEELCSLLDAKVSTVLVQVALLTTFERRGNNLQRLKDSLP